MKITEFKKGDLIFRKKVSSTYTPESKHELEPFIFDEITNGTIYLILLNKHKDYCVEMFSESFDKRKDDDWDYYVIPDILKDLLLERMTKSRLILCNLVAKKLLKQNVTEQTMPEKIRVWSRFQLADIGFYPEIKVKNKLTNLLIPFTKKEYFKVTFDLSIGSAYTYNADSEIPSKITYCRLYSGKYQKGVIIGNFTNKKVHDIIYLLKRGIALNKINLTINNQPKAK